MLTVPYILRLTTRSPPKDNEKKDHGRVVLSIASMVYTFGTTPFSLLIARPPQISPSSLVSEEAALISWDWKAFSNMEEVDYHFRVYLDNPTI